MYSLKRRLVFALISIFAFASICAAIATYFSAQREIDSLLDGELKQVAISLRAHTTAELLSLEHVIVNPDQRVVVQIFDPKTRLVYLSRDMEHLPITDRTGFSSVLIEGYPWRIFTAQSVGGQIIEVAQPTALRTEMAVQSAKRILLPILVMMPIIGIVIWLIIVQGFTVLTSTAQAIARRSPTSLKPLSMNGMPTEIAPLVTSLNDLLARLSESISAQKRFASDAAHELRTPLTALTLQIQLAERAKTDEAREKAFNRLKEGIKRATRLVTQLLTMARLDPDASDKPLLPLDINQLAHSVVDELSPVASQKGLALTATGQGPIVMLGSEDALRLLMNNLVDNAIRYTPEGGHIQISTALKKDEAIIEVADDGPGIPEQERQRIFERFYRAEGTQTIPGTGLGLAIVRRVSELHGGIASVHDGLGGKGIAFRITMPANPQQKAIQNDSEESDEDDL